MKLWMCALCLMLVLEGRCEEIVCKRQNLAANCCNYVLYTDNALSNLAHSLSQNVRKLNFPAIHWTMLESCGVQSMHVPFWDWNHHPIYYEIFLRQPGSDYLSSIQEKRTIRMLTLSKLFLTRKSEEKIEVGNGGWIERNVILEFVSRNSIRY